MRRERERESESERARERREERKDEDVALWLVLPCLSLTLWVSIRFIFRVNIVYVDRAGKEIPVAGKVTESVYYYSTYE